MRQGDTTADFLWSLLGLLCESVMKLDEDYDWRVFLGTSPDFLMDQLLSNAYLV